MYLPAPIQPRLTTFVPIGDAMLRTETVGHGDPLFMLHGLGCSFWSTHYLADALADIRRVVNVENRGIGASTGTVDGLSIATMADDAAAVIRKLANGPVDVLGYSMGGYISQHLAIRHPDVVRSLVLLSTSPGGAVATPVPDSTKEAWAAADAMAGPEGEWYSRSISFREGWCDAHPEEFAAINARRALYAEPADVWSAQFAATEVHLMTGIDMKEITCPVLVIHGTGDRVVPYPNGEALSHGLADVTFVTLPGAGHLSWLEDLDAVVGPIREFYGA
ncbi:MAG: alpha/beta hydrolase [Propionibacteriaceae bacterium]|jgi:pimeloyl-ACP methyl ester carboxylesterase|nr:alpha/beta hydrolase [Propionibacteriaceae bacterium]